MKQTERKFDIRLIYLAIVHIMKSRGNFLYQGATFDANSAFEDSYLEKSSYYTKLLKTFKD